MKTEECLNNVTKAKISGPWKRKGWKSEEPSCRPGCHPPQWRHWKRRLRYGGLLAFSSSRISCVKAATCMQPILYNVCLRLRQLFDVLCYKNKHLSRINGDLQHAEHRSTQPFQNIADVTGVHAAPIVANRHAKESQISTTSWTTALSWRHKLSAFCWCGDRHERRRP